VRGTVRQLRGKGLVLKYGKGCILDVKGGKEDGGQTDIRLGGDKSGILSGTGVPSVGASRGKN